MKLFSLVLVALAASMVQGTEDSVQHLRGEKEVPANEEAAIGVAVKEGDKDTEAQEGPNDADATDAIGVPEKELESKQSESPASNDVDEGVELTLEELDASEAEDKSAWRPGRPGRPGGPVRRRRPGGGGGCRQWVTCVNGFWGGIRCSGNRYCRVWR